MDLSAFLIVWGGMILATYIPRALPALFIQKLRLSRSMETFLNLIPYTAMASLIFPGILRCDESRPWIGLAGGSVAILLAMKKCPVILVVIASILTCFLFYTFI